MKKLYDKSEIWFAVIWIIVYVVAMGNLRANFGDESPVTLLVLAVLTALLLGFILKHKLAEKYGLCGWQNSKRYLCFIPLVLLCTVNFWGGVSLHYDALHQIFAVCTMALVGVAEELIFRGLLYRAMEKNNVTAAIIVSAVTFGAGHIVNLLTGHASVDVLLQMAYAIAIGFAFVLVFHRSGSLIPCIVTHSIIDVTSKFSAENLPEKTDTVLNYATAAFIIVVAGGYAVYLWRKVKA